MIYTDEIITGRDAQGRDAYEVTAQVSFNQGELRELARLLGLLSYKPLAKDLLKSVQGTLAKLDLPSYWYREQEAARHYAGEYKSDQDALMKDELEGDGAVTVSEWTLARPHPVYGVERYQREVLEVSTDRVEYTYSEWVREHLGLDGLFNSIMGHGVRPIQLSTPEEGVSGGAEVSLPATPDVPECRFVIGNLLRNMDEYGEQVANMRERLESLGYLKEGTWTDEEMISLFFDKFPRQMEVWHDWFKGLDIERPAFPEEDVVEDDPGADEFGIEPGDVDAVVEAIRSRQGDPGAPNLLPEHLLDGDFDEVDDPISGGCQVCGGELMMLGRLGKLTHYRCRNCGADSSQEGGSADA